MHCRNVSRRLERKGGTDSPAERQAVQMPVNSSGPTGSNRILGLAWSRAQDLNPGPHGPVGTRRHPRGRGRRSLAGRQPNHHRPNKQSSHSTRALGGSPRLPRHTPVACRGESDGIVLTVRRRVPAVAWGSQDRARDGAASRQDLGVPMNDRFSDRVHRLSDLPGDFRVFHRASCANGLRSRRCLADVPGIWQATGRPDTARFNQDGGAIAP
jgi:hypothetical protein